nr:MAG TPA: hypothetical protein [Caudoviricetes sp.]
MPMGYPFIFNGIQSEAYNVSLVYKSALYERSDIYADGISFYF